MVLWGGNVLATNKERLLDVQNLETQFRTEEGILRAVDRVSFHLNKGETLGIVGESGCGKSITAKSLMNLVPQPRGKIVGGKIMYYGRSEPMDIASYHHNSSEMRTIRGNEISMIFQEPMTSLNPVFTVGNQLMEAVMLHQKVGKREAKQRAIEMLAKVGISTPEKRIDRFPHEFSGGMRQRAMIAMALSCNPHLLIADEPTTALDVTVEAQILNLMLDLQDEMGMAIIMITHDLGVIAGIATRVVVMYAGWVVEMATTEDIFYSPKHPYTKALLQSIPKIGNRERLLSIPGTVPDLNNLERGWCYFAPRCPHAMDICRQKEPPLIDDNGGHAVKCWLWDKEFVGQQNDEHPAEEQAKTAEEQTQ